MTAFRHFVYESRKDSPLPRRRFLGRLAVHAMLVLCLLAFSLAAGIAGYMHFEGLPALDAFLNSAMLLGGMGPVNAPVTAGGKLFAGLYALYAGLVFIVCAALMLTPVLHRILHKFHWESR
jgi:hypothetical protein